MKLTPISGNRRSVASAARRSGGGSQIPRPVIRMAPYPRRLMVLSPILNRPAALALIEFMTAMPQFLWLLFRAGRPARRMLLELRDFHELYGHQAMLGEEELCDVLACFCDGSDAPNQGHAFSIDSLICVRHKPSGLVGVDGRDFRLGVRGNLWWIRERADSEDEHHQILSS